MAFGYDKKFEKKSDMFWYPPGHIFKSSFQTGAQNKPEKIKNLNIDTVRVLNKLELRQHFDMQ